MSALNVATLTRIIELQSAISAELSVSRVMQTITESTQELTGATGAVVEIAQGDEMVYRAASGAAAPNVGVRLKIASSLSGLCVRTGMVLCCHDSELDQRVDREACRRVGVRSMILVPLRRQEQTIGVLKVYSDVPGKFTDADTHVLQLMSGLIAGAMHNAATFESAKAQSMLDVLTALPNRALFRERLGRELAHLRRKRRYLAVLYIDLDGFKPVNDRFGHKAGDQVLVAVAERMRRVVRQNDTVARLGGDEFAILACDLAEPSEADWLRDRVCTAVESEAFELAAGVVSIGASIGVAVTGGETPADILLEEADLAMYTAKRQRKSLQAA